MLRPAAPRPRQAHSTPSLGGGGGGGGKVDPCGLSVMTAAASSSSSSFAQPEHSGGGRRPHQPPPPPPPRRSTNGTAVARGLRAFSAADSKRGRQHHHRGPKKDGPRPSSRPAAPARARPPRPSPRHLEINRELLACAGNADALLGYAARVAEEMNTFNFGTLFNRCVHGGGSPCKRPRVDRPPAAPIYTRAHTPMHSLSKVRTAEVRADARILALVGQAAEELPRCGDVDLSLVLNGTRKRMGEKGNRRALDSCAARLRRFSRVVSNTKKASARSGTTLATRFGPAHATSRGASSRTRRTTPPSPTPSTPSAARASSKQQDTTPRRESTDR